MSTRLEVIVLFGEWGSSSLVQFVCVLGHQSLVDLDLRWPEGWSSDELETGVSDQFSGQPQERLFKVVVGLSGNFIVLEVLLSVECYGRGLDFAFLDVNLVSAKHDGDVLANSLQVSVPVGNVLVGDSRCDVEHDDTTLTLNVVTISQTTKLLLTSSIPDIECQITKVGVELEWVNFDTKGSNILLFKLSSQMTLDKSRFSSSTVTDKDELEGWDFSSLSRRHFYLRLYERFV
jgi:hypothetical protein